MKIVHLTSVHPRYDARVLLKECHSLATAGHDVMLVVADGKGNELRDEVSIVDVGKPRGRLHRMVGMVGRVYETALAAEADVYHLHDPELLRIALRLKRQRGGKSAVVFDAHEDLPRQILSKHWIPTLVRHPISWLAECFENYVAARLSGIIAATPHIAARFIQFNPNTVDINNYPMPDELAPTRDNSNRKQQVCYVGSITRARGIKPLVEALSLVPNVTLVLCGQFPESDFETELRALPGWKQVDYKGQVNRDVVCQVLNESRVGVVTLLPTLAYLDALPVKMFEYMSAELPVIASDFPLWRQIIDGAQAGICVDPESPQAIAEAICHLLDDPDSADCMGKAGRHAVLTQYNWSNEAEKLVNLYKNLL